VIAHTFEHLQRQRFLLDAGFSDVTMTSVPMPIQFESTEEYWQMFLECAAGIKAKIATMPDEDRMKLRRLIDELAAPHMVDGKLRLMATPLCALARS